MRNLVLSTSKAMNNPELNNIVTREVDFSVMNHPEVYVRNTELFFLNEAYHNISIFKNWHFVSLTSPQAADSRNDKLFEDMSNYQMVLNRLFIQPEVKQKVISSLSDLIEGVVDVTVLTQFGHVQLYLTEGKFSIPATRLSDGTLRYLCLLAILCDPDPPALICIEEPELGLHPDILPSLAEHIISASKRTQLIVTTHSEILVDAMTETPESVVVCEKHNGKTELQRLKAGDLAPYLGEYRLGNLWIDGDLGGKRW
jgi:predicted ATPase